MVQALVHARINENYSEIKVMRCNPHQDCIYLVLLVTFFSVVVYLLQVVISIIMAQNSEENGRVNRSSADCGHSCFIDFRSPTTVELLCCLLHARHILCVEASSILSKQVGLL